MISNDLVHLLSRTRGLVAEDQELGMKYHVSNGARRRPSIPAPSDYLDFLEIADGVTLGAVTIIGSRFIEQNQMLLSMDREGSTLAPKDWFVVGMIHEVPLLISRGDGSVWGFPGVTHEWWRSSEFERFADSLGEFLREYVFGERYLQISDQAREDQWWELVNRMD